MKKILFAIALVFTLSVANAQKDGFFNWNGNDEDGIYRDIDNLSFTLPSAHGSNIDYDAPLGSGIAILTLLGAGYAIKRRRKNV